MQNAKVTFLALITVVSVALASPAFATNSTEETSREEVRREVSDAIEAIKGYSIEQRNQALRQARTMLDSLDSRIDQLEDRLRQDWDRMSEATRNRTAKTLRKLREKRNELAEWYGSLRHGSSNAWDEIKQGFSDAYSELQTAWEKADREFGPKE